MKRQTAKQTTIIVPFTPGRWDDERVASLAEIGGVALLVVDLWADPVEFKFGAEVFLLFAVW
jgi:hypothetical protein